MSSILKVAALAVAVSGGVLTLAPADAQAGGYGYGHHGYNQGYAPQYQYVHPKILRKQAELRERAIRKFGIDPYAQQHYGHARPQYYGRGYNQNYGYRQNHGYRQNYGYQGYQPQGFSYSFGW
jgi:hypothetical protein